MVFTSTTKDRYLVVIGFNIAFWISLQWRDLQGRDGRNIVYEEGETEEKENKENCKKFEKEACKENKQAGAELCQAEVRLGLTKLDVTWKKLRAYKLEVTLH